MRDSNHILAALLPAGILVATLALRGIDLPSAQASSTLIQPTPSPVPMSEKQQVTTELPLLPSKDTDVSLEGTGIPPPSKGQRIVTESIIEATEGTPIPLATAPVLSDPGPIRGIDLSMYQPLLIDFKAVKDSGIEFVIIKCTEGTSYVDPSFADHWAGAKKAGLLVSAYHMFWGNLSASAQAEHFLSTMGDRVADFPLSLDVELNKGVGNIGAGVEEMLLALEAGDGRKPIIYTAQSIWGSIVGWAPGWKEYSLWAASHGTAVPPIPTGWDTHDFHQYSSTGSVPGISGNVDLNTFIGGVQDLRNLGQ